MARPICLATDIGLNDDKQRSCHLFVVDGVETRGAMARARKLAIDILAIEVCRAIRDVHRDHQGWISLDRLHDRLGFATRSAIDAAVAFAAAKGWLAIGRAPAYSVLLNQGAP
jgi:hypothetical protein